MDMVSFDPNTLVWWLAPIAVVALLTVALLVVVAAQEVARHHSNRVASHQSRRGYYAHLLHLHGVSAAH